MGDIEKGAGTFNPATFFRALGRQEFAPMDAGPVRRAGEMPELTIMQRMLRDHIRQKQDKCAGQDSSFAPAPEGLIGRL